MLCFYVIVGMGSVASEGWVMTPNICPLTNTLYKIRLSENCISHFCCQPYQFSIILDPPEIPMGFFITSLVDIIEKPQGESPDILTGYPDIKITCKTPGDYLLKVRVNIIAKASCGGVKSAILLTDFVCLTIEPNVE